MASFLAKGGWERPRKSENKNYRFDQFLLDPKQKIEKIQQKNSQNYKTRLQRLFKPKQGGERLRKSENKNYRSDQFLPDP